MNIKQIMPETIKKPLRKSWRYAKKIAIKFLYFRQIGIYSSLKLIYSLLVNKHPVKIYLPSIQQHLFIRPKTSDVATFEKIFILKEYEFELPFSPEYIIDAGANVGYAALYYKSIYPQAKIICLEPESSNLTILHKNVGHIEHITITPKALWCKNTYLDIQNPNGEKYAFRVEETTEKTQLHAITLNEILSTNHWPRIDILKMDIEGAEKYVFTQNVQWLDKTQAIVIELHEGFLPGCEQVFHQALASYSYQKFVQGENTIIVKDT